MNAANKIANSNPNFIARETLKKLASLKIPPTPDNYFKFYNEIIGVSKKIPVITGELLAELAKEFPCYTPFLRNSANNLEDAANELDWEKYKSIIISLARIASQVDGDPGNSARTNLKIVSSAEAEISLKNDSIQSKASNRAHALSDFAYQLLELLGQVLECITVTLTDNVSLLEESRLLAEQARKIQNKLDMEQFIIHFQQFCLKLEHHGRDGVDLQKSLFKFLHLLMDSTGELLSEDLWVSNQISKIKEIMSRPLDLQIILQAENYLERIIQRQEEIKRSLGKAKTTVKQLVNSLINNIEELSSSTGTYQDKLQYFSEQVNQVTDLENLNQLLVEVVQETKQIQKNVLDRQEELFIARTEVNKAQDHISQLEIKLLELDKKIHEDHLTGVFNRRGFDSALKHELSKIQRNNEPLSLVLLDLDNFKLFNDTYGHGAGDDALIFLVNIVKETIRPHDSIARYGGEEFALLLPNTTHEKAIAISARILRNLTKKLFLYKNNRLLITFSAGVAQYQLGESQENLLIRADEAMYRAKKNGKNQIISA